VLLSRDPEENAGDDEGAAAESDSANGDTAKKNARSHDTPKPIVIDRYQFKQDRLDYLGDRYQRLYVFDLESREASLFDPRPL